MASHSKTTSRTVVTYTCDVCGSNADGEWWSVEHTNDEVTAEYSVPIDVCKKHAERYSKLLCTSDNPSQYMKERYDGFSDDCKKKLD